MMVSIIPGTYLTHVYQGRDAPLTSPQLHMHTSSHFQPTGNLLNRV